MENSDEYYKIKYFKYKAKYELLKEQHGGSFLFGSKKVAPESNNQFQNIIIELSKYDLSKLNQSNVTYQDLIGINDINKTIFDKCNEKTMLGLKTNFKCKNIVNEARKIQTDNNQQINTEINKIKIKIETSKKAKQNELDELEKTQQDKARVIRNIDQELENLNQNKTEFEAKLLPSKK